MSLLMKDGAVALEATDTGKGIPSELLEQSAQDWTGALGVGLRGLNERMRQLGGWLELVSTEEGTAVSHAGGRGLVALSPHQGGTKAQADR